MSFSEYSSGFRKRMIQRLTGPEGISAWALSKEVGVSQSTLSRWMRRDRTVEAMSNPKPEAGATRASTRIRSGPKGRSWMPNR